MNEFLEFALEIAAEAAVILRAGHERPKRIEYKGDVDLVTETDRAAEKAIVGRIRKKYPDHAIIAEEGSEGAARGAKYCWYIDPVDGTTNFAHGYPCFCTSIALQENDVAIVGVVVNPITNETFTATRGGGAYLNGKPIHVSQVTELGSSLVATGFPTHMRHNSANMDFYWGFTLRSHGVRRDGSAALDLCSVAAGRFEGFWEFGLNSWDTAAGTLIVREAGGKVTDLDGSEHRPGGSNILATNGLVHEEMRKLANEILAKVGPMKSRA
jgi:myo-inositol-1(or 4)-monophosphatase